MRPAAECALTSPVEIDVEPAAARVHEHGCQSWSPTATYRLGEPPHRPSSDQRYQGEGLLVIDPGDGAPVHRFAVVDPRARYGLPA